MSDVDEQDDELVPGTPPAKKVSDVWLPDFLVYCDQTLAKIRRANSALVWSSSFFMFTCNIDSCNDFKTENHAFCVLNKLSCFLSVQVVVLQPLAVTSGVTGSAVVDESRGDDSCRPASRAG